MCSECNRLKRYLKYPQCQCLCVRACLSCALQGPEIQPALSVLSARCGHTGLSEPQAGQARVRRDLRGPLSQLHSRTSARSLLPTHLCSGAGEIQRGKAMWTIVHCAHVCSAFVCRLSGDVRLLKHKHTVDPKTLLRWLAWVPRSLS